MTATWDDIAVGDIVQIVHQGEVMEKADTLRRHLRLDTGGVVAFRGAVITVTKRTPRVGETVVTAEKLRRLPEKSVVCDKNGWALQKSIVDDWYLTGSESRVSSEDLAFRLGPLTILRLPI